MDSRVISLLKQFLYFLLLLPAFSLNSHSNNSKSLNADPVTLSAYDLKMDIEQIVLAQWQQLGQRKGSRSQVIISGVPESYRSHKCPETLQVDVSKQLTLGRNSLQVSCATSSSWSLTLTAEIEVWRDVVVIRDHLARGERIKTSSLTLQERNIGDLQRGYFTELADVIGNVSKRSLKAGVALNPSMVDLPIIVRRGQAITLRVEQPGLSVNVQGIALKKGRKGDVIKVKNSRTEKVLFGTIINAELILVN